jgi:hypothetical protein
MIKKLGKNGLTNIKSRRIIADIARERNLVRCEIGFKGCLGNWLLAPAHRHERSFYKGSVELLSDVRQWVCACQFCHQIIDARTEASKKLTEEVFKRLRGNEN